MICSSLNRLVFMSIILHRDGLRELHRGTADGEQVNFDERLTRRMRSTLQGRRKLYWLWNKQQGNCPVCAAKITKATGWHVHHVVWRVYGGSDRLSNLQMLHPTCHAQLHACATEG